MQTYKNKMKIPIVGVCFSIFAKLIDLCIKFPVPPIHRIK